MSSCFSSSVFSLSEWWLSSCFSSSVFSFSVCSLSSCFSSSVVSMLSTDSLTLFEAIASISTSFSSISDSDTSFKPLVIFSFDFTSVSSELSADCSASSWSIALSSSVFSALFELALLPSVLSSTEAISFSSAEQTLSICISESSATFSISCSSSTPFVSASLSCSHLSISVSSISISAACSSASSLLSTSSITSSEFSVSFPLVVTNSFSSSSISISDPSADWLCTSWTSLSSSLLSSLTSRTFSSIKISSSSFVSPFSGLSKAVFSDLTESISISESILTPFPSSSSTLSSSLLSLTHVSSKSLFIFFLCLRSGFFILNLYKLTTFSSALWMPSTERSKLSRIFSVTSTIIFWSRVLLTPACVHFFLISLTMPRILLMALSASSNIASTKWRCWIWFLETVAGEGDDWASNGTFLLLGVDVFITVDRPFCTGGVAALTGRPTLFVVLFLGVETLATDLPFVEACWDFWNICIAKYKALLGRKSAPSQAKHCHLSSLSIFVKYFLPRFHFKHLWQKAFGQKSQR